MTDINNLTAQLTETVVECLSVVEDEIEISPALLASCALKRLDDKGLSPILVQWGCNLQCRQIARSLLRKTYDPLESKGDSDQIEMFEGLQQKYPCKRHGENVYVDRMQLTLEERQWNIKRLASEGRAKIEHSDGLQAETDELLSQGFFTEAA